MKEIFHLFLLRNVKRKWEIVLNFCGLLRISELLKWKCYFILNLSPLWKAFEEDWSRKIEIHYFLLFLSFYIIQPLKADACLLLLGLQASIYLILVDWLFISLSTGFFFSRLDLPTFNRKVSPQVWLRWFIKGYWQLFGCVVQGI